MSRYPITARGAEKLREELARLKKVERPRLIQAIAVAREHGDLKENAEYHAAKEEQGFVEGRIQDFEAKLSNAQVIDVTQVDAQGRVVFGATVDLCDENSGAELRYQIVGEDEADARNGMISITSPIARALIGHSEGDVVVVTAPGGDKEYEILAVHYI